MEKETLVTFYIYDVSASGFIFGSAATQSAQCSRVVGGSDEVAGRRWGFLLLLNLTLAQQWIKVVLGHKRSVCLSATWREFQLPPSQAIFLLMFHKSNTDSSHLTPFSDMTNEIC